MSFISRVRGLLFKSNKVPKNGQKINLLTLRQQKQTANAWKTFYSQLKIRATAKADEDILTLEKAVQSAENILNPSRVNLYTIYNSIRKDSHLKSQVRIAHATIQCSDFIVRVDGQDNEELTDLLKKPWFYKFIGLWLETEFWGHSLLEFHPDLDDDGHIKNILLLPRLHVCPIRKQILINPYDRTGIDYAHEDYNMWFMEIGDADNLGLYESAAEEVIYKRYSGKDWSLYSEIFGMPFLTLNTDVSNKTELDARKNMLDNAGTARWAVLGENEKLSAIQASSAGQAHNVYDDRMERCDKALSKLINGQTGTTDEKSHVGAAGVHERILSKFNYQRLYELEAFVNFALFPHLSKHFNYPLENTKFHFSDLLKKDEGATQEDKSSPGAEPEEESQEPAKKQDDKEETPPPFYQEYLKRGDLLQQLQLDLDDLVNKAIRNVYEEKVQEGELDMEVWEGNVQELWKGVQEGMDAPLTSFKYGDPRYELSTKFLHNVQTFAAFKNHEEIAKLVQLLTDSTGAVRSFEDFKALALPVSTLYNGNYLRAEYNHAIAAAQMANAWTDFELDKELFPYLRYAAQNDERTRQSHERMDGITLPVDHSFWDNFTPPNGWGCRCFLQQLEDGDLTPDEDLPNVEQVPGVFRHHPFRTGEVFSPGHSYFEGMDQEQVEQVLKQRNALRYQGYSEGDYNKIYFDESTGGFAVGHKEHQTQERRNSLTALGLSLHGKGVELVKAADNAPDALIDGRLFAFEYLDQEATRTAIEEGIKNALNRANRMVLVVEDLTEEQRTFIQNQPDDKLQHIWWLSMESGTLVEIKKG